MNHKKYAIQTLIQLAVRHYDAGLNADLYAAIAAHSFSKDAASELSLEVAESTAWIAALQYAESMIEITNHTAHLTIQETQRLNAENPYRINMDSLSHQTLEHAKKTSHFFEAVLSGQEKISIGQQAQRLFDTEFEPDTSPQYKLALHAACAHYAHAYASARTAYVHAVAVAARYTTTDARRTAFTRAITNRLERDLTHEPIDPSFFMQIICSHAVFAVGSIALIVGLVALAIGMASLTSVSIGAACVGIGMSPVSLSTAGAAITTIGAGLLACQFFTARQWNRENEASRHAAENVNAFASP